MISGVAIFLTRHLNSFWCECQKSWRNDTDNTLTKWVHALLRCVPICNALEEFILLPQSNVKTCAQANRQQGSCHLCPVTACSPTIRWIRNRSPGVNLNLNCDDVVAIRRSAASIMDRQNSTDIKLHRIDKVATIGDKCKTIKIREQNTVVKSSVLFNRITCALNKRSEMAAFLCYELAPRQPSLFYDGFMREPARVRWECCWNYSPPSKPAC